MDVDRRAEFEILVPVDLARKVAQHPVDGRRIDIGHVASRAHDIARHLNPDRVLDDPRTGEGGLVHIWQVRKVKEIVDEQLVVRGHPQIAVRRRPSWRIVLMEIRQQRRVRAARIPHPHEDQCVLLDGRK